MSIHGWRPFSPEHGRTVQQFKVDTDGSWLLRYMQPDRDDVLAFNRAWYNADRQTSSFWNGSDHVLVAKIPEEQALKWYYEEGLNMWKWNEETQLRVLKKLDDADYSKYRTAGGTLL